MNPSPATYRHTQHARLCWLLYGTAGALIVTAVVLRDAGPAPYVLAFAAAIVGVLAAGFHHLTVEDGGDRLWIAFGPLPLFRRSVRYENVTGAEVGRTTILEGWGIHLSPRGGWVWNIAGRDCVIVALRGGRLTIGTDDATNLADFLRRRLRAEV